MVDFCRPSHTLAEEATESKGGHFAKLKWFSIAKITILWRGLKFKRGHGPPGPPISAAYAVTYVTYVTSVQPTEWEWKNFEY